jgi:hypothetical protein
MATDYITATEFARVAKLPIEEQKAYLKARQKAFKEAQKFIREGFDANDGARVVLSREPGLTARGLLVTPFRFQVPPSDDITISHAFTHTDYETIGGQQFSQPNSLALKTVALSGMMLPDTDISYGVHHYVDPVTRHGRMRETPIAYTNADASSTDAEESSLAYADAPPNPILVARQLTKLMESGTPFRLSIGQGHAWNIQDFSNAVTLRTVSVIERAGEPTTRYADLAFTEYRKAGVLGRKTDPSTFHRDVPLWVSIWEDGHATTKAGRSFGSASQPVTLSLLAQTYYGSSSKWRLIVQAPQNREWRTVTPNTPLRQAAKKNKGLDSIYIPKAPKTTGAKGKGEIVAGAFVGITGAARGI